MHRHCFFFLGQTKFEQFLNLLVTEREVILERVSDDCKLVFSDLEIGTTHFQQQRGGRQVHGMLGGLGGVCGRDPRCKKFFDGIDNHGLE
jgi:hypothetical protein